MLSDRNAARNPGLELARWLGPTALFAAAALVVVWQNSRVAVLYDISYVLNTASRIAGGDVPFRDFPLPQAPGTFLVQALLIRLLDGPFVVQIVYAAFISGVGAVTTYAIVWRLLEPYLQPAGWTALAVSVPATILGVNAVYPHPFYDPDCSLLILVAILGLLVCQQRGWPPLPSALAGVLLPLPFFFKQNTGGAFVLLACGALLACAIARRSRGPWGEIWPVAGAFVGLVLVLTALHVTVGLGAFYHWTITYAGSRRLPESPLSSLAIYRDRLSHIALGAAVAAVVVARWAPSARLTRLLAGALLLVPFLTILGNILPLTIARHMPSWASTRVPFLVLGVWPSVLLLSLAAALVRLIRIGPRFEAFLPLILVGVTHAAFLSQGVSGSSYAIWPLLIVMLAAAGATIAEALPARGPALVRMVLPMASVCLTVAGTEYVWKESRLGFARPWARPIQHARHPRLVGMAAGGPYLPDLDALLEFCEREIPRDQPVLALPGEDPLYFALRRPPALPLLQWDVTTNAYPVPELVQQVHDRRVSWIIVKDTLQTTANPFREQALLLQALASEFAEVRRIGPYRILRWSGLPSGTESNRATDAVQ